MCVGLPAKVVKLKSDGMAIVDASGAKREVSAEMLDDLDPGDYVMVHADIAIAKLRLESIDGLLAEDPETVAARAIEAARSTGDLAADLFDIGDAL